MQGFETELVSIVNNLAQLLITLIDFSLINISFAHLREIE